MNRVRQPFNVNSLALAAAAAALDDMEFVARSYAENLQGLRSWRRARAPSGSTTFPRTAISSPSGRQGRARSTSVCCAAASSCARSAAATACHEHLRVTVGTAAENERFLGALAASLKE